MNHDTVRPRRAAVASLAVAAMLAWSTAPHLSAQTLSTAPAVATPSYEEMFDAIVRIQQADNEAYIADGGLLQREAGTFAFTHGTIILTQPLFGSVRAVVFTGTGTFDFTPPTAVEQEQLQRFFGDRTLSMPITGVVLFVADSTVAEMTQGLQKAPGGYRPEVAALLGRAVSYIQDTESKYIMPQIMRAFLDNRFASMLYAYVDCEGGPLFFSVDPYSEEEVSLMRLAKGTRVGTYGIDVINSFHTTAEHLHGIDPAEDKAAVAVNRYTIDCSLNTAMEMTATAELDFTGMDDGAMWIPFTMYYDLDVTSVVWSDGTPAVHFKGKDNQYLWVRMPQQVKKGEQYRLRIGYKGAVVDRLGDYLMLKAPQGWYPLHDREHSAMFDVTYHVPERYTLVGIGTKVSEDDNNGVRTSRWTTTTPVRACSFAIGKYEKTLIDENDSGVPVVVLMNRSGEVDLGGGTYATNARTDGARGADMDEQVGGDVATSLAFYQKLYGKAPVNSLHVCEAAIEYGLAFPGLVQLPTSTFYRTGRYGDDEMVRAHEVAQQWWGLGVEIATYRDQWLSDAFSEYSALMYMQLARNDNELFFKRLETWRDRIVDNRKTLFGAGVEAGPIWLGRRTNTSSTQGDYGLIVYEKGAWVLHMLRNILIDIKTLKEDRFFAMMKDFYTTYQGRRATTDDFHGVVEKHVGMDMDWFFNQWVYGTAIPKYTYATRTERTPDGKYKVTMRVTQSNVPNGFQMPVPLFIDFGDDKFVRLRIMVSKPQEDIVLPLLPMEPRSITFNIYDSVLCEAEEGDWE